MDTNGLRDYLNIVLDMEKNIFLRQKLIVELEKKIKPLGIPQRFKKPIRPQEYSFPSSGSQETRDGVNSEAKPPSGCLVSISIMIIYFIVFCIFSEVFSKYMDTVGMFALPTLLLSILIGKFFQKQRDNYEAQKKFQKDQVELEQYKKERAEQEWSEYLNGLHIYNQHISNDAKRIQKEREQRDLLSQEIDELTQKQKESEQRLTEIYKKNVIFPKYRNLIAIASLYEYICAGRCSSLEGHKGAYNIYETEVRLDHIITQLDQVIIHLDAIRNNQFVLYSAIQDVNKQCAQILQSVQEINQKSASIMDATWTMSDNIVAQLDSIDRQSDQMSSQLQELQKTSALAAYHVERTQKELAYMNRMDYLAGRNDDVFFNHPPVQ